VTALRPGLISTDFSQDTLLKSATCIASALCLLLSQLCHSTYSRTIWPNKAAFSYMMTIMSVARSNKTRTAPICLHICARDSSVTSSQITRCPSACIRF